MKINEIKANANGVVECAILKITETAGKNGSYLNISISDGEKQVVAKMFKTSLEGFPFKEGDAVFMALNGNVYNDTLSYIVNNITKSSSNPEQFLMTAPVESEVMFQELYKLAGKCGVYATVVMEILKDNKEKLLVWGAAKSVHHNIRGGLLYHSYRMAKTAVQIANTYNSCPSMLGENTRDVNTGLLVAGAILHDIGKLQELETNMMGESVYTPIGNMMGHLYLGAELVGKYADKYGLDKENKMLLQHLILSHHGTYEFQAVSIPAIPEAQILHHIDAIDAAMYQFEITRKDMEPGTASDKIFGLGQVVYKPF